MSEYIYVTAVIDAKSLYQDFKNKSPSKDPTKPTPINLSYGFLITERKYAFKNSQGTADLSLIAKPGDTIRFSATSESNNFEHVVVLYDISEAAGYWTTPQFVSNYQRRMVLTSNSNFTDFTTDYRKYAFVSLNIIDAGTVPYKLKFILYERVSEDDKYFNIFGYFEWDPTIIIKPN